MPENTNKYRLFILTLLAMTLMACGGGRNVVNRFYVLEFTPEMPVAELSIAADQPGVFIAEPLINPAVAGHQIALREKSHELRYFSHHEWAIRPDEAIRRLMTHLLDQSGAFSHITTGRLPDNEKDLVFQIRVDNMELLYGGKDFAAHLKIEILITDPAEEIPSYRKAFEYQQRLPKRDVNHFAAALSHMFAEATAEMLQEFRVSTSEHP